MSRVKLFVGNLPADTSEQDLRHLFAAHGDVKEVHVMSSARSRLGYACAFVVFGQDANADEAIAALNGKHRFSPDAEAITVSFARPAQEESGKKGRGGQRSWEQDPADQMWYQQQYAMQLAMMQAYGMYGMGGYGGAGGASGYNPYDPFSMYGGGMAGLAAAAYPAGLDAPEAPSSKGGGARTSDPDDAKLFLGGLPNGVTEAEIRTVFSQVGSVKEVHIMHGKSQSGQACAFVVYPDQYSAQLAIRTLNKTPWHSAPDQPPIIVRAADKVPKKKGSGGGPGGAKDAGMPPGLGSAPPGLG